MWHFNGVKLSQSTEKQQILANGTLVIRQATLSDAGHYKCTATATAGQIEAEANVRVIGTYIDVDNSSHHLQGEKSFKVYGMEGPKEFGAGGLSTGQPSVVVERMDGRAVRVY